MRWLAPACAALMLMLMLGGCARFGLHRGQKYGTTIKNMDVKKVPVKGFKVHVVVDHKNESNVDGELLAVGPEFLYVMKNEKRIVRVPRRWVGAVHIWLYRSPWGSLLGWTGAGAALSISHGLWMMASIPAWVLASAIITPLVGYEGRLKFTPKTLNKLFQYARFPAGFPKEFYAEHMCRTTHRGCPGPTPRMQPLARPRTQPRPPPRMRQPPRTPPAKRPRAAPVAER